MCPRHDSQGVCRISRWQYTSCALGLGGDVRNGSQKARDLHLSPSSASSSVSFDQWQSKVAQLPSGYERRQYSVARAAVALVEQDRKMLTVGSSRCICCGLTVDAAVHREPRPAVLNRNQVNRNHGALRRQENGTGRLVLLHALRRCGTTTAHTWAARNMHWQNTFACTVLAIYCNYWPS